MTLRTSYARRGAVGTMSYSSSVRRSTGSVVARTGGRSRLCRGEDERESRTARRPSRAPPPARSATPAPVGRRHRDEAAVDRAGDRDRAVGGEVAIAETGVHVVGEQPVLDPCSRVDEQVEPVAHRQLPERALPLDELLATHLQRARLAGGE